jgi:hypothetical protein
MTSAFRDHSVSVRSLAHPSVSLLRGTPRAGCDVVGLSEEAEEMAGVRLTQRAPDPRKSTETMVVGVAAFSGTLCGLKLAPAKWRSLVPPTSG